MPTKNTKKVRKQSNLSRALSSSNRGHLVVERFFSTLSAGEIRRSVSLVARHRHFYEAVQLNSAESMFYAKRTPDLDLEKTLSWCLGVLEVHAEKIRRFLDFQSTVLSLLLNDERQALLQVLNDLDLSCGISVWSIGLRSSLLGLESQDMKREYISALITKAEDNNFFKSIIFNLSTRLDDFESLPSDTKFFEQKIRRSFSGGILHFLMYKLVPYNADFVYDFTHILQTEKESSPIDLYLCLLDLLIHGVIDQGGGNLTVRQRVASDLFRMFPSAIASELAVAHGLIAVPEPDQEAMHVLDLYTSGDYAGVCSAMEARLDLSRIFALVEIWAKSLVRCPDRMPDGPIVRYLRPLCDVILKSADFDRSKALLLACSFAYQGILWHKELRFFLDRETRFFSHPVNQRLKESSLLISPFLSPAKSLMLSRRIGNSAVRFGSNEGQSVTVQLFSQMHSGSDSEPEDSELTGIEPNRRTKFRAQWNVSRGRYDVAIPLLLGLRLADDIRVAQDANRALVEAYLAVGKVEEAADVFVQTALENINMLSVFDSSGLCEACTKIISKSQSIAISIALSLHSRYVSDSYAAALKYSFERFLTNNGLVEPLDILQLEHVSADRIHYFLEHVCTPEVMKLYLHFESSKQIEEARILICRTLLERDVSQANMEFEVKDRTRRLVLREATSQVDQSRIYSDVNLLSGSSAATFQALFERFSAIRAGDFSNTDDEQTFAKLAGLMDQDSVVKAHAHSLHLENLVLNEKNALFLKLLKLVRDEFAFGDRGLNVYLSTRIRHGHLPNTLRRPLLDNSLLASRVTDAGSYRLNAAWADALQLPLSSHKQVEHAIMDFSMKFAVLVDELNDQWLRLFTIDQDISGLTNDAASKTALFNYSVSSVEAYYLQTQLDKKSTYTEFVALATAWLWSRTEQNLVSIRERLDTSMRSRASELLEELQRSAIQKCGIDRLGDVPDSIARARTGLSQALDTIRSWFTRARGANISSFELDVPVSIARRAADATVYFQDETGLIFKGAALNAMVDVFYNLFENCVSKSGIEKPQLWVKAAAKLSTDGLLITVENNCEDQVDYVSRNESLRRYSVSIGVEKRSEADAAAIGGSGFFKISRALEKDLAVTHSLNLGYESANEFRVTILIPFSEIQKATIDEISTD